MSRLVKTITLAGLLAACALVGGAGTKTEPPAPDAAVDVTPSPAAAPTLPDEAPPPDDTALSAAPPPSASPPEAPEASDQSDSSDNETPTASAKPAAPVAPPKRPRYAVAVIQALDKVTAETIRFEAPINRPIRYKTLIFTVHACETTTPDDPRPDAIAHMEIDSQPLPIPGHAPPLARRVFRGWMFADSPGLDLFQHPVYDAWLVACKTALPST